MSRGNRVRAWAVLFSLTLFGCASGGGLEGDGLLEPVDPAVTETPSPVSPGLAKLLEKLQSLGYEGIGLTYESDTTLELLYKVFSDPLAMNRQVRAVYTGLANAYDAKAQSLTIGGASSEKAILAFIKKIPLKP